MSATRTVKVNKLTSTVGAEVLDVDVERLVEDEDLPEALMAALEENGVLLFRELNVDDRTQADFCHKLGTVYMWPNYDPPEISIVSLNPENPLAEYLHGAVEWHIDGTLDQKVPMKAAFMSARVVSSKGGETEFASTYAGYELLSDEEKERCEQIRVWHSFAATQRTTYSNPTPEQLAEWERRGGREHPLVWTHRDGRKSIVLGSSADYVIGVDADESRALINDLLARITAPERVYQHSWSVGDTVIWNNCGLVHRVLPYDPGSRREMHRTSLLGDEPIG
jgi:alpha-ketoglutarate-dependent taurine dioxygenase